MNDPVDRSNALRILRRVWIADRMRHLLVLSALILVTGRAVTASAQGLPSTDIFITEMPGEMTEMDSSPANVTERSGYDNQPAFSSDGRSLLFSSIWEDGQADIYRIEILSGVRQRITFTQESEYSPAYLPDASGFSVVRVEADGSQRLWRFSLDGRTAEIILDDIEPVGYYCWISPSIVALFVLDEPHRLVLADVEGDRRETIASDIGRSLHRVPGRNAISYVQKRGGTWSIDMYDVDTGRSGTITHALDGRQDFAWTPDGRILMADENVIFEWSSRHPEWRPFLDLSRSADVGSISRIAVSPRGDILAFVAETH